VTAAGQVLVISDYEDVHADAVIDALNVAGVPVFRLNTSDFGSDGRITFAVASGGAADACSFVANPLRTLPLESVRSVWYRRPVPVASNPRIAENARPYAREQFTLALRYLEGVVRRKWVNHPDANRRANNKIVQLEAARRAGLSIPDTLLTNDPEQLDAFRRRHAGEQLIVKDLDLSVAGAKILGRGVATQLLPADHAPSVESVTSAPFIVQPFVPKEFELRCTLIGTEVFAARIDTPDAVDWRNAYAPDGRRFRDLNRYSAFALPPGVRRALLELAAEFELRFAAIDLIVTPSGECVFLELNPNGQWLWLQRDAGLPLIEAMARELAA
jgi:glutathione synthase/RimK-type ligase-like ATP-grasp enzyme